MGNYDISKYTAYFNGDWIPYSEVKIDPLDRGFFLGDSVFEVERTFNGKSFKMREHIERLYRSLSFARIDPKIDAEEMINISEETINKNLHLLDDVGDFLIQQFITRGFGRRAAAAVDPTVCVRINPIDFERYPIEKYYSGGHCAITSILSYPNESIDPKVKNYSRMNFNLLGGFDETFSYLEDREFSKKLSEVSTKEFATSLIKKLRVLHNWEHWNLILGTCTYVFMHMQAKFRPPCFL